MNQELLKSMFEYDPDTGKFTRTHKISKNGQLVKCFFLSSSLGSSGYYRVSVDRKSYLVHRLIFLYVYGAFPIETVDHVNGIRTDNRLSNLRVVSQKDNARNMSLSKSNRTGNTGVFFDNFRQKWLSSIMVDGKTIFLGRFISKDDAIRARKSAEKDHHFHVNHGKVI